MYLEIWLKGFAEDYLRDELATDSERYHPHVTLVRPFILNTSSFDFQDVIAQYCSGINPLFFALQGNGMFDEETEYVPLVEGDDLLVFSEGLERVVAQYASFKEDAPGDSRVLHATVPGLGQQYCPRIEQCMLRMTAIENEKVQFSYDFVHHEVLDRFETLDKTRWKQTVAYFLEREGLQNSPQGFISQY